MTNLEQEHIEEVASEVKKEIEECPECGTWNGNHDPGCVAVE